MKFYAIIPRKGWTFTFHYRAKTLEAFKTLIEQAYWNWRASQSQGAPPETLTRDVWEGTVRFVSLELREVVPASLDWKPK